MTDHRVHNQEMAIEMAYAEHPMRDRLREPDLGPQQRAYLERSAQKAGTLAAKDYLRSLEIAAQYGTVSDTEVSFEGLSLEERFNVSTEDLINSYPIKMNILKQLPGRLTPRNIRTARDVLVFGKDRLRAQTSMVGEKSMHAIEDGINRLFEHKFEWKKVPSLQDITTYCDNVSQISACVLPVKTYGTWHKSEPSVQDLIDMSDDDLAFRLRITTPKTVHTFFGGEPDYTRVAEVRRAALQYKQDFLSAKQK